MKKEKRHYLETYFFFYGGADRTDLGHYSAGQLLQTECQTFHTVQRVLPALQHRGRHLQSERRVGVWQGSAFRPHIVGLTSPRRNPRFLPISVASTYTHTATPLAQVASLLSQYTGVLFKSEVINFA